MQIHTVKQGDTIFTISRLYSTSPMKIIENNSLTNPDRLAVGQKLLILTPTRTYSVRGGDTLSRIAKRFGVTEDELFINNPYLAGSDRIYPGQILTIKKDSAPYGIGSAVGFYYRDCSDEKLKTVLPYLSRVAISSVKRTKDSLRHIFDASDVAKYVRDSKKIPLLRVYDECDEKEYFNEPYIETLLNSVKNANCLGLCIAAYKIQNTDDEAYKEFILKLKRKMLENGLLLFCEADGQREISAANDAADGIIILYDKFATDSVPTFKEGEMRVYTDAAKIIEPSKLYMDFTPFGYIGNEPMLREEIHRLACTQGYEIKSDVERGISYFSHNVYKNGVKSEQSVVLEDPENIKARLNLAGELGYMGISFDIMRMPTEYLMMFSSTFSLPSWMASL